MRGPARRERLAPVERYWTGVPRLGLAEHHGTPLGHGPSQSIFMAAATQRRRRLRLGPLAYCLHCTPAPAHQEVSVLDLLSDGRLRLGDGAGMSLVEDGFFGVDWDGTRDRFDKTFEILLRRLQRQRRVDRSKAAARRCDFFVPIEHCCRCRTPPPRSGFGYRAYSWPNWPAPTTRSTSSHCSRPGSSGNATPAEPRRRPQQGQKDIPFISISRPSSSSPRPTTRRSAWSAPTRTRSGASTCCRTGSTYHRR